MVGKGRHSVLGIESADPLLQVVGALGLAASVGTALVIDLPSERGRSLADLTADGPSSRELAPGRTGVAVIGGGGLEHHLVADLVGRLAALWPAVVVAGPLQSGFAPGVRYYPLYPGRLSPEFPALPGVWQPMSGSKEPPAPGPVMPHLRNRVAQQLLDGRMPRRSNWIASWTRVWEMPWG